MLTEERQARRGACFPGSKVMAETWLQDWLDQWFMVPIHLLISPFVHPNFFGVATTYQVLYQAVGI